MRNHKPLAALLACAIPVIAVSAVTPITQADQRLTLEQLYPEKSLLGRGASGMRWSNDGSQLIYQWSPYQAGLKTSVGADIYLYTRSNGKTTRLTSPEMFASVDRDIAKVIEQLAEEQKVLESRKGLTEKERKVLEDADKDKDKARKEPRKSYPGVSEAVLSDSGTELLLTYKGDIYRLALSPDAKPVRLTRTADVEADVRWTPGDKGFTFRRGEHIYRRIFGDVIEAQISPVLPDGLKVEQYWLSKDGSRIGVLSSKRTGPPAKNVSYIVYRDRFA
jgi:dipeptidyl-peptidase-4